jgi:uncharacterized protein YlzI (FlbEa/FlbD family)
MPNTPAPATEVRLTNGQAIAVTESVDAILDQRHQTLAGIPALRLTLEDGRQIIVAAGQIVSIQPVTPPTDRRAH